MSPASGPAGSIITLTGTQLSRTRRVSLAGVSARFSVINDDTVLVTVPLGAPGGTVSLTTPNGTNTTSVVYEVVGTPLRQNAGFPPASLPSITSVYPASGSPATIVHIRGANLSSVVAVTFGGASAPFANVSPTEIGTVVPPQSGSGRLVIRTARGTTAEASFNVQR
jgi:IPT/TIG domain